MKAAAIALIVLGILSLAYGGISWTTQKKVVDLGPVQVTHDKTRSLPLPPVVGGLCLVGGVLVLLSAGKSRA